MKRAKIKHTIRYKGGLFLKKGQIVYIHSLLGSFVAYREKNDVIGYSVHLNDFKII